VLRAANAVMGGIRNDQPAIPAAFVCHSQAFKLHTPLYFIKSMPFYAYKIDVFKKYYPVV
jgi:hypothetical protein